MLELTESTIAAVKEFAVSSGAAAGLRIFAEADDGERATLSAAVVEWPAEDDEIVEADGARVYLDADAAVALADKVLDAYVEGDSVRLALLEQS